MTHSGPLGKLPEEIEGSLFTQPNVLFWGGPVSPLQVNALLFSEDPPQGKPLTKGLYLLKREQIDELFHEKTLEEGELRVFLGYAGWAPRQLAREISRGDWSVQAKDVATLKRLLPEQLWPTLVPNVPSPWI